jgi:hypothetical protein
VIGRIDGIKPADFKCREIGGVKRAAHRPLEAGNPGDNKVWLRPRGWGGIRELSSPGSVPACPHPSPRESGVSLLKGGSEGRISAAWMPLTEKGRSRHLAPKPKLYEFAGSGEFVHIHSAMCSRSVRESSARRSGPITEIAIFRGRRHGLAGIKNVHQCLARFCSFKADPPSRCSRMST